MELWTLIILYFLYSIFDAAFVVLFDQQKYFGKFDLQNPCPPKIIQFCGVIRLIFYTAVTNSVTSPLTSSCHLVHIYILSAISDVPNSPNHGLCHRLSRCKSLSSNCNSFNRRTRIWLFYFVHLN